MIAIFVSKPQVTVFFTVYFPNLVPIFDGFMLSSIFPAPIIFR